MKRARAAAELYKLERAAIVIQKYYRGWKARKDV